MTHSESTEVVARFRIPGEPASKARPRFTKRGSKTVTYTPEKTKQAEREIAWTFRSTAGPWKPDNSATFGVSAVFRYSVRQRRDVDNMLKLILDGLNGVAWDDDVQVVELCGRKELVTPGSQGTDVVVYRIGTVEVRTATCQECGKEYRTYPSWSSRRYCTDDCRLAQRRAARMRTCEGCGKRWDAHGSQARWCSKECMTESSRVRVTCSHCGGVFTKGRSYLRPNNYCSGACSQAAQIKRRTKVRKGDCQDCGGPVSKASYQRCAPCSAIQRGQGTKGRPVRVEIRSVTE